VIFFDKRGTGLSDPVSRPPGLAERMDDIRAVMDAVGSQRAALFGVSDGGCLCILMVEFASHEQGMENSGRPETGSSPRSWPGSAIAR
jgi:alpha-beta hydrolase superfamily lysophospholipase